jgi:hypothetical protein
MLLDFLYSILYFCNFFNWDLFVRVCVFTGLLLVAAHPMDPTVASSLLPSTTLAGLDCLLPCAASVSMRLCDYLEPGNVFGDWMLLCVCCGQGCTIWIDCLLDLLATSTAIVCVSWVD